MVSVPALIKKLPLEGESGAQYEVVNQSFPGNDERMTVLHQDSGGIGKSIPSALEIFLGHGFFTPRPIPFQVVIWLTGWLVIELDEGWQYKGLH